MMGTTPMQGRQSARQATPQTHSASQGIRQYQSVLLALMLFAPLLICVPAKAQDAASEKSPAERVAGFWITQTGDGLIQIEPDGDSLTGKIAGSPDGVQPQVGRLDVNNPDPAVRNRPLRGLTMMGGYRYTGKRWKSGWIYDPNNGKRYKSTLELIDDNTLKVRGYIGVSLLGRTQTWTRQP